MKAKALARGLASFHCGQLEYKIAAQLDIVHKNLLPRCDNVGLWLTCFTEMPQTRFAIV